MDKIAIKTKTIFAIVVLFNGDKWVRKCLQSLEGSNLPLKVIAIDNNSDDESAQIVESNFPNVELIRSGTNLGFGKANNIGIEKAYKQGADYVFLLNQDAWIEPDTIEKLVLIHQSNTSYGILSPVHLNGEGSAIDGNFASYLKPEVTPEFLSDTFFSKPKMVYFTTYVNAAAWLLSKKCIEVVGGFDPIFEHYGEDDDYLKRAVFFNFKIGIAPNSKIFHDRITKSETVLKFDHKRILIRDILKLKNITSPFRSNLLLYFKDKIDIISSLILYRKFREANVQIRTFRMSLSRINEIYISYNKSRKTGSYLG